MHNLTPLEYKTLSNGYSMAKDTSHLQSEQLVQEVGGWMWVDG